MPYLLSWEGLRIKDCILLVFEFLPLQQYLTHSPLSMNFINEWIVWKPNVKRNTSSAKDLILDVLSVFRTLVETLIYNWWNISSSANTFAFKTYIITINNQKTTKASFIRTSGHPSNLLGFSLRDFNMTKLWNIYIGKPCIIFCFL